MTGLEAKPCPFCGCQIVHVESLAKSFTPPRLYHEWHHGIMAGVECHVGSGLIFAASDNPKVQQAVLARWNRRPGE